MFFEGYVLVAQLDLGSTIVFGRSDLLNLDQPTVLHVLNCSHRRQSHGTESFRDWKFINRPVKVTLLQELALKNSHTHIHKILRAKKVKCVTTKRLKNLVCSSVNISHRLLYDSLLES